MDSSSDVEACPGVNGGLDLENYRGIKSGLTVRTIVQRTVVRTMDYSSLSAV